MSFSLHLSQQCTFHQVCKCVLVFSVGFRLVGQHKKLWRPASKVLVSIEMVVSAVAWLRCHSVRRAQCVALVCSPGYVGQLMLMHLTQRCALEDPGSQCMCTTGASRVSVSSIGGVVQDASLCPVECWQCYYYCK